MQSVHVLKSWQGWGRSQVPNYPRPTVLVSLSKTPHPEFYAYAPRFCAGAFPIKASDHPSSTFSTGRTLIRTNAHLPF